MITGIDKEPAAYVQPARPVQTAHSISAQICGRRGSPHKDWLRHFAFVIGYLLLFFNEIASWEVRKGPS